MIKMFLVFVYLNFKYFITRAIGYEFRTDSYC